MIIARKMAKYLLIGSSADLDVRNLLLRNVGIARLARGRGGFIYPVSLSERRSMRLYLQGFLTMFKLFQLGSVSDYHFRWHGKGNIYVRN